MDRRTFLGALMTAALPFPSRAEQCTDSKANAFDIAWLADQMERRKAARFGEGRI